MADEVKYHPHETKVVDDDKPCDLPVYATLKAEECTPAASDRGLFDFGCKKEVVEEEKCDPGEVVIVTEFEEKLDICGEEEKVEEKKHDGLLEKLHRSGSSSSASSDEEEVDEKGEKRKKKKGLKEKIEEKIWGEKEEAIECDDASEPVAEHGEAEDKEGFLEKIKETLPGGKKPEEVVVAPLPDEKCEAVPEAAEEKKGFLENIKEKISGEKEEAIECDDTAVLVAEHGESEDKKGFLEKIKEKLPGGKKPEEVVAPPPAEKCEAVPEAAEEKKGFLEKIKEKLPGHHHHS